MAPERRTTRLAPSPTGDLHLGNLRSLLVGWALARRLGWNVVLRIEDLDGDRCRAEWEAVIIQGMRWLGMDWDGSERRQSDRIDQYASAMRPLSEAGLVFSCQRSRRELRAAAEALGAPHAGEGSTISTVAMRPTSPDRLGFTRRAGNHRLMVDPRPETVRDELLGEQEVDVSGRFGDPIVWTWRDTPSYQLAVVVDDLDQGVTDVVRASDLLPSAGLQQRITGLLGGDAPRWWHLPLLLDEGGRRLAKRDGDLTLGRLRSEGTRPEMIIGLLARTCEMQEDADPMTAEAFVSELDPERLRGWAVRDGSAHRDRLRASDYELLRIHR